MSPSTPPETTAAIIIRLQRQRELLQLQFVEVPKARAAAAEAADMASAAALSSGTAMQPYRPRSLTMKLLQAHPQIVQRLLVLAVTTAVGARYSSWAVRLLGLFLTTRKQ